MNFKKATIGALLIAFFAGIFFFAFSFKLPMSTPGMVIGPGYYPRMLSIFLIISSVIGLIVHVRKPDDGTRITMKKPLFFFLIIALATLLAGVWQITNSFYPIASVVTMVLLWVLNPEKPSRKKAAKTVGIAVILLGAVYLLFSAVLQLNL